MNETTLQYIESRAKKSEDASIVAVSCPDIHALLAERAELIAALEQILTWVEDGVILHNETGKPSWHLTDETAKVARAAITKTKEG